MAGNFDLNQKGLWKTHCMLGPDQFPDVSGFQDRKLLLRLDKVIPSDPTLLDDAVKEITAALDYTACWDDADIIGLVVQEALANAIVHGNHCDPETMVRICIAVNENCDLLVTVKDSGSGFDPSGLPNPLASESLLAPHGRGIFLMRQFMDEVDFKFDHGTEVHMRRRQKWLE
jgi:anti-sigma regulatory factor (Ser/Thr protein kinase)